LAADSDVPTPPGTVFLLRPARPDEAGILTGLCLRSKAMWGYDAAFMAACREALTLTPDRLCASRVRVAVMDGQVVGVAEIGIDGETCELAKLFIEPRAAGTGVGRALFDWAVRTARDAGAKVIDIVSDPNAAGFYRRMGAVEDGVVPSEAIPGRVLPRFRLALA